MTTENVQKSLRFPVPSVLVLIVLTCLLVPLIVILTWRTSRTGIRHVEAMGGYIIVPRIPLADFANQYIKVSKKRLATDFDVIGVHLEGPRVQDELMEIVNQLPNLSFVWIEDATIDDRTLAELSGKPQINDVTLNNIRGVTDAGIAELDKLPNLWDLHISNLPITGSTLSQLTTIQRLYVRRCQHLDPSAIVGLSRLPNLTRLSFEGSPLTDEQLSGLAGAPVLNDLWLDGTDITDVSLSFIVDQFPDLGGLSLDDLDGITDEGAKRLAALDNLQELKIRDSNISPETVESLQQALPGCRIIHTHRR